MRVKQKIVPLDDIVTGECDCEFTPYDHDPDKESCHFLRRCKNCGHTWYGLHCPHDGYQNSCSQCGTRPIPVPEI